MRKGLLILIAALVAGGAAFCVTRCYKVAVHHQSTGVALDAMPELEWLETELKLTGEQFAKVRELHVAYRPKCADMCRRIAEAHEKIEAIAADHHEITPNFQAALKAHADLHVEGQEAMLKHLYETAAALNREQARRYLETMLPFALDFTNSESGNRHAR